MEGNTSERRTEQQCLPPRQPYPWFLYFRTEICSGEKIIKFCSILDPTITYIRSIPELIYANLWTLQHGWCLVANFISPYTLFLWNPFSLQKIELPHLTRYVKIGDCILSSSPTATDQVCSIFLFSSYKNSIFYCQLGDDQWTEEHYLKKLESALALKGEKVSLNRYKSYLTNPFYCNGCLYAESSGSFLVVIEKKHGSRGLKINPTLVHMPTLPSTRFSRICRLLGSNNELFLVEILHTLDKVISLAVYKFEFSLSIWEKVKNIKDRVFFISYLDSRFSYQTINPETDGGRIYFTLANKSFVYTYNNEDKSLMFSQAFPNLAEMPSRLMWFMPDIRLCRMTADMFGEEREKAKTRCGAIHYKEKKGTTTKECELPLDVARIIAKLLYGFDFLHFRATDKVFWLGAPLVQWNDMSMLRYDDHSLCPLLVFLNKNNIFTFVHPKHGLKYKYSIKLPKVDFLRGFADEYKYLNSDCEICYSKDGWLLLTMNANCSFFFNPFTKEVKPFKYGPITIRSAKCVGFSNCPTSYKCVIIDFGDSRLHHYSAPILTLIDYDTRYDSSFNLRHGYFSLYNKSPTFHNGTFYYLSHKGMLGVVKLREGEGASWKEFSEPQCPCNDYINNYLVECNGNQLAVFEGHPFGKRVRVFKLNESTMTWTKVKSLGNHMLFVGNTSFSAVANIRGMENKIYFPRFYGQSIVFYSLETNSYRTFEDEVVNFESVREPLNSSWIEPNWH